MSKDVSVIIAFCEGPHDTAFVRMVLKHLNGFSVSKLKFSEMPAPFDRLFSNAVKNHAAEDMALDMAHKFFLPDTVLSKESEFIFLYNSGGKNQYEKIRTLLSDYLPMLDNAATFATPEQKIASSIKYLFLYDTDADGLSNISARLIQEFNKIDGRDFISNAWQTTQTEFALVQTNKILFVWGATPDQGTLEDILIPMFKNASDKFDAVEGLFNEHFLWDVGNKSSERAVAELEKRNKAVLTALGQRDKPGSSLNVILEQSGKIDSNALGNCKITKQFSDLLNQF